MKKIWRIFTVMIIAIMTITSTVFAKINLNINVDGSKVTINGTTNNKADYAMMQTWNGDKKYQIDATEVDEKGNFNFKFKTTENLDFQGSLNVGGEIKKFKFSTKSKIGIESLKFIKKYIKLNIGQNRKLQVNILPKGAINQKLIWKTSDKDIVTVNEYGEIKGIKEGKAEIEVSNEQGNKKDKCIIDVFKRGSSSGGGVGNSSKSNNKEVTVYVRVEGYDETIIPRTKVKTGLFNLNPYLGPATGSSATKSSGKDVDEFKEPTHAHALVTLLNQNQIEYDFQDYGWSLYIAMINGDREFDQGPMSGWMYSVNGQLPSVGCNEKPLKNGDEVLWFYGAYGFDNIVTTLKADKTKVKAGEEITLSLDGFSTVGASAKEQVGKYGKVNAKINNAIILVNKQEYTVDGEVLKTDENGKCKIKFKENGTYKISATRRKTTGLKKIDIVRPEPLTIVVGSGASTGGGSSSSSIVNQESEKALNELEKKLEKMFIGEDQLNIHEESDKHIITISESIISSKVRKVNKIISNIKEKYKRAKLNEDVNLIPIKISSKDSKNIILKLNGSTANYLSNSKFGLNIYFPDSQIKVTSNKISHIKYDERLEIRKINMQDSIKNKIENKISAKERIMTSAYNIELYRIKSNGEEEKLDLKGLKIGLKVDDKQLKNISKKSLRVRIYDSNSKKIITLKSNYIAKDNMVMSEVK